MSAQHIVDRLAACGISVAANDNDLVLSPLDRVTPVHVAFVREHKTALLAALRSANDPGPSIRPTMRLCCDCIHGTPALAGSAVSWHSCIVPKESHWHGWWGLSEHYCEAWEAQQDRRQPTDTGDADRWQA